ncbi:MAG: threonylcarbamoyl-AMP synthase [Sphingobacteriia bacterium]|nr:threonylcarbamoyl-AMP synthase [Sphingobacteriia bacterium]
MRITIHPENPQERLILQVKECLEEGGVIIYPTDTVYGLGCDLRNRKAIEKICRIRNLKPEKANFSIICSDLGNLSQYTLQVQTPIYKMMKRTLPGPYTYIFPASGLIPRYFQGNKKTIGIRIPDHPIPLALVEALGFPMVNASLHDEEDKLLEFLTDPDEIYTRYHKIVDMVIDGGYGGILSSTIIDCTEGDGTFKITREGKGDLDLLY